MASDCRLQRFGIEGIDILGDHTGTLTDLRSVAGDRGNAVTTTQGFFQQLATGTTGGTNDCDFAHDVLQLDFGESVQIWMMKGLCGEGFTYGEGIYLWRGDLSPFGGEAVAIHWTRCGWKNRGRFAAQRG
jgi:hypothetical protein